MHHSPRSSDPVSWDCGGSRHPDFGVGSDGVIVRGAIIPTFARMSMFGSFGSDLMSRTLSLPGLGTLGGTAVRTFGFLRIRMVVSLLVHQTWWHSATRLLVLLTPSVSMSHPLISVATLAILLDLTNLGLLYLTLFVVGNTRSVPDARMVRSSLVSPIPINGRDRRVVNIRRLIVHSFVHWRPCWCW